MHSPKRIPEVLDLLDEVWSMVPSSQLMAVIFAAVRQNANIWSISDNLLIEKLIVHRDRLRADNEKTAKLLKGAEAPKGAGDAALSREDA